MGSNATSPIRSARIRLGLSRDELGRILGVSGRSVSYWESGRKLPNRSKAAALKHALGLSEVDLWRAMHRAAPKMALSRAGGRAW